MEKQIKRSVMEAIGHTPLVQLGRIFPDGDVIAKLEFMNPGGSIKDRMVRYMLQHLPPGTTHVVESSSGNTGAALAMASAVLGLDCDIAVPGTTSGEKIKRIATYGAKVHVCMDKETHGADYLSVAQDIAARSGAYHLDQYCSELNRQAHYTDTAPELWTQLNGELDVFVCGIGSGGTISGIGRYLKERRPSIRVIGIEPVGSAYRGLVEDIPQATAFSSVIEGIGKPHPSLSFDPTVVDEVIQVSDEEALAWAHRIAQEEGILAGGSSGSVTAGIAKLLPRLQGARVVTIFPDSGVFYLSKYF